MTTNRAHAAVSIQQVLQLPSGTVKDERTISRLSSLWSGVDVQMVMCEQADMHDGVVVRAVVTARTVASSTAHSLSLTNRLQQLHVLPSNPLSATASL